jgi:hypothetical protein
MKQRAGSWKDQENWLNDLARLTKKNRKDTNYQYQNEKINAGPLDIIRIIREWYKQFYTHQFYNVGEMDHSLKCINYHKSANMQEIIWTDYTFKEIEFVN